MELQDIRQQIDSIDTQLIELFKQRMNCAKEVGLYKKKHNTPILNEEREQEILNAIKEKGGEYGNSAQLLFSNIMELSRGLQHDIVGSGKALQALVGSAGYDIDTTSKDLKIACQGIKGANSHAAVNKLFPNCEPIFYKSFGAV